MLASAIAALGLTPRPPPRTVGVIGGGIAGLACARRLEELGLECTVFDTGKRGPGGRASSRMWRNRPADHTIQSVGATPGSAFHKRLLELEASGLVKPWSGMGTLSEAGFALRNEGDTTRYIGVGGMSTLADELARGLDIRQDTWVSPNGGIFEEGGGWCVLESRSVTRRFDAVVIAHNGKCAERLTSKISARPVHMLLRSRFAPAATGGGAGGGRMTLNSMYSLLIELPAGVMPGADARNGVDGAYVEDDGVLRYVGCNDAKYAAGSGDAADGRGGGTEVWTVLSSGAFGKAHKVAQEQLEGSEAEGEVTALLLAALERAVGLSPGAVQSAALATKLQLWGAAIPMNRWDGQRRRRRRPVQAPLAHSLATPPRPLARAATFHPAVPSLAPHARRAQRRRLSRPTAARCRWRLPLLGCRSHRRRGRLALSLGRGRLDGRVCVPVGRAAGRAHRLRRALRRRRRARARRGGRTVRARGRRRLRQRLRWQV